MTVPHKARRDRGLRTEKVGASFWRRTFPEASHKGGSSPGADLLNTPGFAVEIKARRDFAPLVWLKQAIKYSGVGQVPFVMWRPDGYGEQQVERWPCIIQSRHLAGLIERASKYELSAHDATELYFLRRWAMDTSKVQYAALLEQVDAEVAAA